MNNNLQLKIQYNYESSVPFIKEFAAVKKQDLWGFISKDGKFIIDPEFTKVEILSNNLYLVRKNELMGIYTNDLKELISLSFNKIDYLKDKKLLQLTSGQNLYYFNLETNQFISPK